jgi:hypothetical protein
MRRLITAAICALTIALLGGCASTHGVVDNCPDVKNENPSLLQGRGTGVGAEF